MTICFFLYLHVYQVFYSLLFSFEKRLSVKELSVLRRAPKGPLVKRWRVTHSFLFVCLFFNPHPEPSLYCGTHGTIRGDLTKLRTEDREEVREIEKGKKRKGFGKGREEGGDRGASLHISVLFPFFKKHFFYLNALFKTAALNEKKNSERDREGRRGQSEPP